MQSCIIADIDRLDELDDERQHELELLQRLLSERFGDSSSTVTSAVQWSTAADAKHNDDANIEQPPSAAVFRLFAIPSSGSVGESDTLDDIEGKHGKSKKRKRLAGADDDDHASLLPLIRLVSPERVYEGPGRGRPMYVAPSQRSRPAGAK